MRRFPFFVVLIVAVTVAVLIFGWQFEKKRYSYAPAIHAQKAPSALYARMSIKYAKPPIDSETYAMQDVEGVSSFSYQIRSYECREITVRAPAAQVMDVSFFFGKLVQDGIWQMMNKAPLPNAPALYSVYVKQLADYQEGNRTVTFTNPDFWATTAGRQYTLDLSKINPKNAGDLLRVQSTQLSDPRYQEVVQDFRQFGPDEFRRNVAAAQARARRSICS
ncbi:MAG: hypothetical protein JO302_02250 [Candidatus Eremiobacteraeota bacterium]|nr:hypothetical protein [Candidatus Eremiobacteraeota bacterium]